MKNLNEYRKSEKPGKLDAVQRSVNIERKHQEFLNENNLNLSEMLRDYLDAIMVEMEGNENE